MGYIMRNLVLAQEIKITDRNKFFCAIFCIELTITNNRIILMDDYYQHYIIIILKHPEYNNWQ